VPHGLTPYGTEAMHVLRAEKGYVIVGQETDGSVTPQDLGVVCVKQKDFIGRRSFSRRDTARAGRKQLVGLLPKDRAFVAREGEHLVNGPGSPSLGHVTSSYWSPTLDSGFALALVTDGRALHGKTLYSSRGLMPMVVGDPCSSTRKASAVTERISALCRLGGAIRGGERRSGTLRDPGIAVPRPGRFSR
jgi:sarcosine oxidase subunit alpha